MMRKYYFIVFIILGINSVIAKGQIIDTLVDVNGYSLHFTIISGKGMPVLFETGYGNDATVWTGITQPIADITGAPIITYDRQGFGTSSIDANKKGIEDEVRGLEKALTKLGYDKEIILVSHSLGGFYNSLFTTRNPQKVKGIIFIDANIPCFFTEEQINKMGNLPFLREMVDAVKKNPLPLHIPVFDIISEQTAVTENSWKTCHDAFVSESPNRKSIYAYETSHYVFVDNSELAINAIVTLYANTQKPKEKAVILERGYAHELTSSNENHRKLVKFQHSDNDLKEWGISLLQKNEAEKAFEVMKLNVSLYPGSATARSGLGEAYLKTGNLELAALNYKKSLELNPADWNAKIAIDQISTVIEVPDSILSTYAGEYQLNGGIVLITKGKDKLTLNLQNIPSVMYFTSNTNFFISDYRAEFKFTKDAEGKVNGFNLWGNVNALKVK